MLSVAVLLAAAPAHAATPEFTDWTGQQGNVISGSLLGHSVTLTGAFQPGSVFDGIKQAIVADRYAYFSDFFANFYNTDVLAPERIGDAALRASFQVAAGASPYASYACVDTWLTDFRHDLPKIDIPTLVVHGTADRILPFAATAARLRDEALIADLTVIPVEGGPHNIGWTHPDEVNRALLEFLAR